MVQRTRVAVIGGGAAGLVSARWLLEEGLEVVLFEGAGQLGGVWRYDGDADGSTNCTYKSLRTNLPTAVMQLRDFAYSPGVPSYPSYHELGEYLTQYAAHFNIDKIVRFHSTVTKVSKTEDGRQWRVKVQSGGPSSNNDEHSITELFDNLVICNGHYSKPFYVPITGIEHFRGEVMHSQKYRTPDRFVGKSVLLIGLGQSGKEISFELVANGAKDVTVAFPKYKPTLDSNQPDVVLGKNRPTISSIEPDGTMLLSDGSRLPASEMHAFQDRIARASIKNDKRVLKPKVDHITPDGNTVVFADGSTIPAPDVIIFCTGYVYSVTDFFPTDLLYPNALARDSEDVEGHLGVELASELRKASETGFAVAPLYKQVVAIEDPSVAFIGLPFDTVPFQISELQAMWVAKVFVGSVSLASRAAMYDDFYAELRKRELPLGRDLHQLGLGRNAKYYREMAALSGTKLKSSIIDLLFDTVALSFSFPTEYRSATYLYDPLSGSCVRHFTPSGSSKELVRVFE